MPPSELEGGRRRVASRDGLKTSFSKPFTSHGQKPSMSSISPIEPYSPDIDHMMEPAVDGPPSPERLRQLSNQMKRASNMNRTPGHRTASSASSPRRAIGIDRPQWEQSMESTSSLTRRSSSRSSDSNAPSRGRSERESVQALGRNFFQRSNTATTQMSKRTSSPYSSSSSSMYSTEGPSDTGFKEIIPNIFTRRKQSRDDTAQRKLQISGPFNFQHVTHTNRGHLSIMPSELSDLGVCGEAVTSTGIPGLGLQDAPFFKGSAESLDTEPSLSAPASRASFIPRHGAAAIGPRRMLKTAKSQDQLRSMTQASSPPISPTTDMPSPPVPPRSSSRQSALPDNLGPSAAATLRAMQAGSFRQPKPYSPSIGSEHLPSSAIPQGSSSPKDMDAGNDDRRFSHAITTAGDTAWPLSAAASPLLYDQVLADVPEEEEQQQAEQSRQNLNVRSSLRGSHSVPILRNFPDRPPSATSDTLGQPEVLASLRDLDVNAEHDSAEHALHDDNWEDVIDYCYEHEAEANFDYQWDRPSMDVSRDLPSESAQPKATSKALNHKTVVSPVIATTANEPLSSFSSRASSAAGHSSVNTPHLMPTNNFSLPRGDNRAWKSKNLRPISHASTYKESQGFNLSPSLLIPGDYHQQMIMAESERYEYQGENEICEEGYRGPYHDDVMGKEPLQSYLQRSSTSTTETVFSSDTTGERHVSANSTFTTLTRLTMSSSTTSLNKVAGIVADCEQTSQLADGSDKMDEEDLASKDTVGDLTPFPVPPFAKKSFHKSHASESIVRDERSALSSQETMKPRRPRARTSSLSAQVTPPIGQYALFPRAPVKNTGDRI